MTSKKYTLLAGLGLIATSGFAQVTPTHPYTAVHPLYGTYLVTDSNYYSNKWLPQHSDFMVGTSDYPAKPRDMWELGIKGGSMVVVGDMTANPLSWGVGAHIRKALGHVMSLRLEYLFGVARGENWKSDNQAIYNQNVGDAQYGVQQVFANHRTEVQDLSLQALATIHQIRFYKAQTAMNFYALGGVGFNTWRAKANPNVTLSNYAPAQQTWANHRDILKDVRNALDNKDVYTWQSKNNTLPWSKFFAGYYRPSFTVGLGMAFRINDKVNIAIEDRGIWTNNDYVDGILPQYIANQTKDWINYATLGLNFNLGNRAKAVEPLYWLNPLNYAYSELRRVPEIVLPDADGDGVTDQFDQEQTPAGCPVDTHGVSRDTDGDGVPDCKDKELVTPTYCQPVDADGVGKCPCPEGCGAATGECATLLGALPSVSFKSNSAKISSDAAAALATVASKLRANPNCKVVVVGYCAANKRQQQLSWDHVNAVINHLVEKEGISSDRFIFSSGQEGGDCDTVDLRAAGAGEDGPNTVAPPHPNLRKS